MKKILLTLALALGAVAGYAADDAPAGHSWFHWTKGAAVNPTMDNRLGVPGAGGVGTIDTVRIGTRVPEAWAGCEIKTMRFYVTDKRVIKSLEAWIAPVRMQEPNKNDFYNGAKVDSIIPRPALETLEEKAPIVIPIAKADIKDMATDGTYIEVTLSQPYKVPAEGCVVGYDLFGMQRDEIDKAALSNFSYPIIAADWDPFSPDRYWMSYMWTNKSDKWIDLGNWSEAVIPTKVLITTDVAAKNGASIWPSWSNSVFAVRGGDNGKTTMRVTNSGILPLSSIAYTVTDPTNGQVSAEQLVEYKTPLEIAKFQDTEFSIPAGAEPVETNPVVTITKVNGQPNEARAKDTKSVGTRITLARPAKHRVLFEEYTSIGCGWCPKGGEAIKELYTRHPDEFVAYACHFNFGSGKSMIIDPMVCDDITDYFNAFTLSGAPLPSAYVSRDVLVDPITGSYNDGKFMDVDNDVKEELAKLTTAEINVTDMKVNSDSVVSITSEVNFLYSYDKCNYSVIYAVVGDGLKNNSDDPYDDSWDQVNYYSGKNPDANPLMEWWCNADDPVRGATFNHVLLAMNRYDADEDEGVANTSLKGVEGSIKVPFKALEPQKFTSQVSLKGMGAKNIDLSKLTAVAILVDTVTNKVINVGQYPAAQVGIEQMKNDIVNGNGEVMYFNLQGQRVMNPVKGIYIRKEGTKAKKIVL